MRPTEARTFKLGIFDEHLLAGGRILHHPRTLLPLLFNCFRRFLGLALRPLHDISLLIFAALVSGGLCAGDRLVCLAVGGSFCFVLLDGRDRIILTGIATLAQRHKLAGAKD